MADANVLYYYYIYIGDDTRTAPVPFLADKTVGDGWQQLATADGNPLNMSREQWDNLKLQNETEVRLEQQRTASLIAEREL